MGEQLILQIKFINYFSAVGILSSFIFGIVNLAGNNFTTCIFELSGSFLATVNVLYFRFSRNYNLASFAILLFMAVLLIVLLFTGGLQGTGIYWFYTFPVLAFFLKGKWQGLVYLLALYLASIISYYLFANGISIRFYYSFIELRQMLASLTAVSILVFFYEKIRGENYEKIRSNEKDIILKHIFDRQIKEAGEIQKTFIPQESHHTEFMQINGYYKPAMEIGGDYFDIFTIDENRTGVIICDVSSKGIPAALIMVKLRTMIKMVSDLKNMKPSALFSLINTKITEEIADHMFITAIYLIINQETGEIEFSNAGHLPLTIYTASDKSIKTINAKNLPIGITEYQGYSDYHEKISAGDIIILYTDGINEQENHQRQRYGQEMFHQRIKEHPDFTAKEISQHIIQDIDHFKKGAIQNDDIALVVIKIQK